MIEMTHFNLIFSWLDIQIWSQLTNLQIIQNTFTVDSKDLLSKKKAKSEENVRNELKKEMITFSSAMDGKKRNPSKVKRMFVKILKAFS